MVATQNLDVPTRGLEPEGAEDGSPLKSADVKRLYDRPASFTDLLPWVEYDPTSQSFLLEDGISVGALFELEPVGTEARTNAFMTALRDDRRHP